MKILNKFIWSKKEPSNKNDIWFDGSTWRMYTEEAWQSFTLPIDAADKVAKVLENASEVYQEKLNAGYGIVIEGNTISLDVSSIDINVTYNIGSIQIFDDVISSQNTYYLTTEDIEAIKGGKLITTTYGDMTIPAFGVSGGGSIIHMCFYAESKLYDIGIVDDGVTPCIFPYFCRKVDILLYRDDFLSEISENSVQNKVITAELNKKLNKTDVATINGQSLTEGGNIVIEENSKIILNFENLGEPIEFDEEGMEMRYSKEQFENAVGMSMSEFIEKIKTSELVFLVEGGSLTSYYTVADEYTWAGYYKMVGLFTYALVVDTTSSEENFFVATYDESVDLPFARTEYVDEKHAQTETKLTELSAEIEGVVGGDSIVYDETKVQTIRYMKVEEPFVKGQTLEITLTENAATMSQGINIYRVVSATAMYIIGHFNAVGQTINVVLEDDAPQGLQFENLDANTTYGVRVVAINRTEGRLNVVEQQISNLSENVEGFSESANKIDSITDETKSINLFDKTNLVVGYIQEGNGTIYASTTSSCSALIPIQGGHYYLLSGRDNIGTTGIRCLDADGNIMKVLIASTDAELSTFACPNERGTGATTNGQFKTPNNAVYVQFTAVFSGKGSVDNIMLTDLGITYSANPSAPNYEPYGTTILVKYGAVPNPLLGKSVIFTGDSICNASSDYANGGGWAKRIGEKNGMTWVNRGISGGTITSKEAIGGYFTISETDFGNGADYIILEGGTNDADRIGSILNGEKPTAFGTWDIGDYTSNFTNDTFCGALEMMLKKIITDFPTSKVGFIIAMKMGETSKGYTADKYNRRAYFETIIQICHKWGVPVLNLWDECTMNPKIPSHYTSGQSYLYVDGQHPTGKGYDFITPIIEAWMKTL